MKFSESARQNETRELTNAILESQNKLAQMLVQNNQAQAAANVSNTTATANNNANNIQINTTPFPPIEDIVSGIVRAQSQLFREMAETQTKELSAIISVALKESHQLSTQAIIDAIKTLQKENLKILEMQAKTTPVYVEQPLYADRNEKVEMPKNLSPEGFADKFIKNKREQNSQSSLSDDEEEAEDDEDLPAPEPIRLTEVDASEPLQKKKKKKKKKKNKSRDDFDQDTAVNEDIFATGGFADKNNGGLDASLFDFSDLSESHVTAENEDFDKDFSFDKAFAADTAESDPKNHDFNFDDVELPSLEEKTDSRKAADFSFDDPDKIPGIESYSDQQEQASAESPLPEENEDEWEYVEIPEDENAANLNFDPEKRSDEDVSADSDDGWVYEEVPEDEAPAETDLADAYEETTAENNDLTAEEQTTDFDTPAESEAETGSADFAADENGTPEGEDWEWEYEEVPEDENRKQEYKNYDQELAQVLDDETPLPDQKRPDGQDDFSPDSAYLSETDMPDLETPHKENISTGTEETPAIAKPATETGEKTDEPLWNEPFSDTENGQEENSCSGTATTLKENSLPAAEKADTDDLPENDENGISGVPGDFNPLYSGDLIFHENVYNQPQLQAVPDFDIDIGITDVSEGKSEKEPYSPKN